MKEYGGVRNNGRGMMDFLLALRKYRTMLVLGRLGRRIQYFFQYAIIFNIKRFLRVWGFTASRYDKLKSLKDKHRGERCFIIATGPSLTIEDLEKLHGETTFSMNSICLAFDETDWRPTYFGIQDRNVLERLRDRIERLESECVFIGDNIAGEIPGKENHYVFPLNLMNHRMAHKKYHSKFSADSFSVVYSGYSITYSLLQIAVYMGFKEIYLLGADCSYPEKGKHHFKEYGHIDPSFREAREQMIAAYKVAKTFADEHGIKIFNATRGGALEVFERVNLDEVLGKKSPTSG